MKQGKRIAAFALSLAMMFPGQSLYPQSGGIVWAAEQEEEQSENSWSQDEEGNATGEDSSSGNEDGADMGDGGLGDENGAGSGEEQEDKGQEGSSGEEHENNGISGSESGDQGDQDVSQGGNAGSQDSGSLQDGNNNQEDGSLDDGSPSQEGEGDVSGDIAQQPETDHPVSDSNTDNAVESTNESSEIPEENGMGLPEIEGNTAESGVSGGSTGTAGGSLAGTEGILTADRIFQTIQLDTVKEKIEWDGEAVIYWNPGGDAGDLEEIDKASSSNAERQEAADMVEIATPSQIEAVEPDRATASDAQGETRETAINAGKETGTASNAGRDSSSGLTPENPVKSFQAAVRKAKDMAQDHEMELEDVIIYAMSPMEIQEGEAFFADGKGAVITSWPERTDGTNLIFRVEGGQLSLKDLSLVPGDGARGDNPLIWVEAGKLQLDGVIDLEGNILLDYRREGLGSQQPIIELKKNYEVEAPVCLEVLAAGDMDRVEVVRSLYADDLTEEEFAENFTIVNTGRTYWELTAKAQVSGTVRRSMAPMAAALMETGLGEEGQEEEVTEESRVLSRKAVYAVRAAGEIIYWNPGGEIRDKSNNVIYSAGFDTSESGGEHAGNDKTAPLKTLEYALEKAGGGGRIVCVQQLKLDPDGKAWEYLYRNGKPEGAANNNYIIDGLRNGLFASLEPATEVLEPIFVIEEGATLDISNVEFHGVNNGNTTGETRAVQCNGGTLILNDNVITDDSAYIQVDLNSENIPGNIPIQVNSGTTIDCQVLFGGINDNLGFRFLDVVVPGGELAGEIAEDDRETKDSVGKRLLEEIHLHRSNAESQPYKWVLRQDTNLDDNVEVPQNLELYTPYYYDAVYIDGQNGNDSNVGASCLYPVRTFERAKEILEREIKNSVDGRKEAIEKGESYDHICIPDKIYVCGTIDVTGTESWELGDYTDEKGEVIEAEIVTHTTPARVSGTSKHSLPGALIHVHGSEGKLTLGKNVKIRSVHGETKNNYNNESYYPGTTVLVTGQATLTMTSNTNMTGSIKEDEESGYFSPGVHVSLGYFDGRGDDFLQAVNEGGGTLIMSEDWTGKIEKRRVGIYAAGNSVIEMNGGYLANNGYSQNSYDQTSYGSGITCTDNVRFTMNGGEISSNRSTEGGAGVYMQGNSQFIMNGGRIRQNHIMASYSSKAKGGGVYLKDKAHMVIGKDADNDDSITISENEIIYSSTAKNSFYGGGICADDYAVLEIYHGMIEGNGRFSEARVQSVSGAGIAVLEYATFKMTNGIIQNNESGSTGGSGGGIYLYGFGISAVISGGTIESNKGSRGAGIYAGYMGSTNMITISNVSIKNNVGSDSGGGIYVDGYKTSISDSLITGNESSNGGGIYLTGDYNRNGNIQNVQLTNNKASQNGGGLYVNGGSKWRLQDVDIDDNEAADKGGGIYVKGGTNTYLTDSSEDSVEDTIGSLKNNHAKEGGGIYVESNNTSYNFYLKLDPQKMIQNSAEEQGNNVYMKTGTLYLISGNFLQPGSNKEGIYNIYADRVPGDKGNLYLDPQKVMVGGEDQVFLNTGDSYLTYLGEAPNEMRAGLPIDLNSDTFEIGSVVVKPADLAKITLEVPIKGNYTGKSIEILYDNLKHAAEHLEFYDTSKLPEYTALGSFRDAARADLTNLVLLGEGIYLDGIEGNNDNDGLSPGTAVKTFEKAKERLKAQIEANPKFRPYIYICGNVPITASEVWDLSDVQQPDENRPEEEKAQVRRFASFLTAPMITVKDNGQLTIDDVMINGMAEAVEGAVQADNSPVVNVESGGILNLNGDANLKNNYSGVVKSSGNVILDGNENQKNRQIESGEGYGLKVSAGSVEMKGHSRIILRKGERPEDGKALSGEYNKNEDYNVFVQAKPSYQGIFIDNTSGSATVTMNDNTKIEWDEEGEKTDKKTAGVYMANTNYRAGDPKAEMIMNGSSCIQKLSAGIDVSGSYGKETGITLNDDAQIKDAVIGIAVSKAVQGGATIVNLNGNSHIHNNGGGIWTATNATYPQLNVYLSNSSSIHNNISAGISIYNMKSKIHMKDTSSIKDNGTNGIQGLQHYGEIEFAMESTSESGTHISGNGNRGIYSEKKLTAKIGQNAFIDNNKFEGIYVKSSYDITVTDATISGNGIDSKNSSGIYLGSSNSSKLTIEGKAAIANNGKYGIWSNGYTIDTEIRFQDTASGSPCVTGHGESAIKLEPGSSYCNNAKLYLTGSVQLKGKGEEEEANDFDNVDLKGWALYLAGTADIEGRIYLRDKEKPITMISPGTKETPYRLRLVEDFVGKVVVQPDGETITDMKEQEKYFEKAIGEGLAEERDLYYAAYDKSLRLRGENNVYISGQGSDSNSGITPNAPVRTFKRAKALLEGAGEFYEGANILVCDTVIVLPGDEQWNFDNNGRVTNNKTGETWRPYIKPYEGFPIKTSERYLIKASYKYGYSSSTQNNAKTLTLRNITISGEGYDKSLCLLAAQDEATVTLGEGASLENGTVGYNGGLAVHLSGSKTDAVYPNPVAKVILDGGSIHGFRAGEEKAVSGVSVIECKRQAEFQIKSGSIFDNYIKGTNGIGIININANSYGYGSTGPKVGAFTMSGGTIENNQIESSTVPSSYYGVNGIVRVSGGTATIQGGSIRNNRSDYGSAVSYTSNSPGYLQITGGTIENNTAYNSKYSPTQEHAPIYINGYSFRLGGRAIIEDAIYLNKASCPITLVDQIYRKDRSYQVYLNAPSYYQKGSIVVQPDNNKIRDVKPYLVNFDIMSAPYIADRGQMEDPVTDTNAASGVIEENCIVLMKAVFMDSVAGKDNNSGVIPSKPVATFERAVNVGKAGVGKQNYYVIYLCGPARSKGNAAWSIEKPAYMCRYTGFEMPEQNKITKDKAPRYQGYLIEPQGKLTLENIRLYGRRFIDSTDFVGDSAIHVPADSELIMGAGTSISRNRNLGHYDNQSPLTARGGGISVEAGGKAVITGGCSITENEATYGTAVFLAGKTEEQSPAKLSLEGSPMISGDIHLAGRDRQDETVIDAVSDYIPPKESGRLSVHMEDDYNGRTVIRYPEGFEAGWEQLDQYALEEQVAAMYEFVRNDTKPNELQLLQRNVLYLDGTNGDDEKDGSTPESSKRTLRGLYEALQNSQGVSAGTIVFIVGEVPVDQGITLSNKVWKDSAGYIYEGIYEEPGQNPITIKNQVIFKRYSKPVAADTLTGYGKESYKGTLFSVKEGGQLTLKGITLDGHSQNSPEGIDPRLKAEGIQDAEGPLISVKKGGKLVCEKSTPEDKEGYVKEDTNNLFRSNKNQLMKTEPLLGTLLGPDGIEEPVIEGTAAGIEILEGGTSALAFTSFENLQLSTAVPAGGTDVYNNGRLEIREGINFTGSVFLEGLGNEEKKDDSRVINVMSYGKIYGSNFTVTMRDPYEGRPVVESAEMGSQTEAQHLPFYILMDHINEYFALHHRDSNRFILELTRPKAVYIDGQNGEDNPPVTNGDPETVNNTVRGWTPKDPIKTFKEAYRLLKLSGGRVIYVVDTVDITGDMRLSGKSYYKSGDKELLSLPDQTDRVELRRYVQPDLEKLEEGTKEFYQRADFTGPLLRVKSSGILTVSGNPDGATGVEGRFVIDGEKESRQDENESKTMHTNHGAVATDPLIVVEKGGRLDMERNVTLRNNKNHSVVSSENMESREKAGGAIQNHGTITMSNTEFQGNEAGIGAGVYQNGEFTILDHPEGLVGQGIYLGADENYGTWNDKTIGMGVLLDESVILDVDMDHAVAGRDVVVYGNHHGVDFQHVQYRLGNTVPDDLFLVEEKANDNVLELQNWKILDVTVPEEMFLAVYQKGSGAAEIKDGASDGAFVSPEYQIVNQGKYDVKVSVSGVALAESKAGTDGKEILLAGDSEGTKNSSQYLYLAIKGLNKSQDGGNGFGTLEETSLAKFQTGGELASGKLMGTLKAGGGTGTFTITGTASGEFVANYLDSEFPMSGENLRDRRMAHYRTKDETTGEAELNKARARFKLRYRVEPEPSRRPEKPGRPIP